MSAVASRGPTQGPRRDCEGGLDEPTTPANTVSTVVSVVRACRVARWIPLKSRRFLSPMASVSTRRYLGQDHRSRREAPRRRRKNSRRTLGHGRGVSTRAWRSRPRAHSRIWTLRVWSISRSPWMLTSDAPSRSGVPGEATSLQAPPLRVLPPRDIARRLTRPSRTRLRVTARGRCAPRSRTPCASPRSSGCSCASSA